MSPANADPVSQSRGGEDIRIPPLDLAGSLRIPRSAYALVTFAHGSGSSRLSPRNLAVAHGLNEAGIATLLFDLLTSAEEADRANVFNIPLLAERLVDAIRWLGFRTKDVIDVLQRPPAHRRTSAKQIAVQCARRRSPFRPQEGAANGCRHFGF